MKAPKDSRLFWFAVASAFLSSLATGIAAADGTPPWVLVVVSAASAAASAGAALLRLQDGGPR